MLRHAKTQSLQEVFLSIFFLSKEVATCWNGALFGAREKRYRRYLCRKVVAWKVKRKGQPEFSRSTHSLQSARDGVPQFVCHAILRCQTTDVCKGFISDFQSIVLFASAVLPGANAVEKKWCPTVASTSYQIWNSLLWNFHQFPCKKLCDHVRLQSFFIAQSGT